MMQWAAMVMRKIYVNARRPQSKRNRAEPFGCRSARRLVSLAAGCSRLDTTSKNAMPGNIRVIVAGSGIGDSRPYDDLLDPATVISGRRLLPAR